ncbi:MAG TPA: sulfite exporter TauE/SafE family protein [Sedimenticola thiotaurini]|uniref:Probable membrane transporter protein n=1 Tax=Sedimenticola thiotaurini TaxID=1543721 RepID=A0A831W4J8_9GAMM|nr:sulfite exporter TauE/SafE family protein [Sedimenticola thiotaurini]
MVAGLPRALVIGGIAGVGGGLASLGGGTLVIPLLMGWLGMQPLGARGTAMAVSLFSAAMGSLVYAGHDMLDLPVAVWVAVPSFLLAPLLAAWSERWPAQRLKAGFGLVVVIGGLLVIFRDSVTGGMALPIAWQPAYLVLVGVVEGAVSGIIGISGGPVLAPLFVLGLGMPQQLAQGCSLAARLPAVVSGTWENARLGNIRWHLVPGLAGGAMAGAWAGSHLALWLPERGLRMGFGLLLIGIGLHYLATARPPAQPGRE